MLKRKLYSLIPFSTTLLRRGPIPPHSTAAASFEQSLIAQFCSRFYSFCSIESQEKAFPFSLSSPRVFQSPRHHLELLGLISSRFCSTSSISPPSIFRCWNCNAVASNNTTPFLVCQSCRSVQPVDHSIDYFQILGMERKYEIKVEDLEVKYKDWQKKLHPDLVHTKSKEERDYAAEQSARVNDAYRTLADTLSRAVYILKLEGVEVDEEERISDPELLAEIMEVRETVEEAADTQSLNQIQAQIQKQLEHWSGSFADAFHSRKYEEAISSIQRMTYYKRANEEIIKKL